MSQKNILAGEKIGRIHGPEAWRHYWNQFRDNGFAVIEVQKGLLYSGLDPDNWDVKQIYFFLDLADGHMDSWSFVCEGEDDPICRPEIIKTRQELSACAFHVLCSKFFRKPEPASELRRKWDYFIFEHQKILPKLLWFLRRDELWDSRFLNFRPNGNHEHQRVAEFALDLCTHWLNKKHFRDSRPQLVEILDGLGKLDTLFNEREYPLDWPSMVKLRELALDRPLNLPAADVGNVRRLPRNLEEAVLGGSKAARFLQLLLISNHARNANKRIQRRTERLREIEAEAAKLMQQ